MALLLPQTQARAVSGKPSVSAQAAVLMDADSGRVIYGLNENQTLLIASTTKIMTALIAIENCNLKDTVNIKREWTLAEGSSMYLQAGETYTVEELLYGLMLASGNDAALALACHTAGTVEAFAELMNMKAAELKMTGSHFVNPHGLNQKGHYSTAADMGLLASAAMKNKLFYKIVSTKHAVIKGISYTNHNKLLWLYDGAVGIKTGYTKEAGRALVSCATRGETTLVCVTLNAPDDWDDHKRLLDWGFLNYKTVKAESCRFQVEVISGTKQTADVICNEDLSLFLEAGQDARIEACLPKFVYAPVRQGEKAGELRIVCEDRVLGSADLVYEASVFVDESIPLNFWEKVKWSWFFANKHGYSNFYPIY
jgi:D-alanyl-D-alanine carboxypeptidase